MIFKKRKKIAREYSHWFVNKNGLLCINHGPKDMEIEAIQMFLEPGVESVALTLKHL